MESKNLTSFFFSEALAKCKEYNQKHLEYIQIPNYPILIDPHFQNLISQDFHSISIQLSEDASFYISYTASDIATPDEDWTVNSKASLKTLINECTGCLKTHTIVLYGKEYQTPRLMGQFGNMSGYGFSGNVLGATRISAAPSMLRSLMYKTLEYSNRRWLECHRYNGAVVNCYLNGESYIAFHADDEKELISPNVIGFSYGATRKFVLKEKVTKKTVVIAWVSHNSYCVMQGREFQKKFLHGIPKEAKVNSPRISITLRAHDEIDRYESD
jgi:alkylated DNA repair dioxygenase AlkB